VALHLVVLSHLEVPRNPTGKLNKTAENLFKIFSKIIQNHNPSILRIRKKKQEEDEKKRQQEKVQQEEEKKKRYEEERKNQIEAEKQKPQPQAVNTTVATQSQQQAPRSPSVGMFLAINLKFQ
jgi:biotin carboxyl carrier protein